jgi:hypothetical protein
LVNLVVFTHYVVHSLPPLSYQGGHLKVNISD